MWVTCRPVRYEPPDGRLVPMTNVAIGDEVDARHPEDFYWYKAVVVNVEAEFEEYTVRFEGDECGDRLYHNVAIQPRHAVLPHDAVVTPRWQFLFAFATRTHVYGVMKDTVAVFSRRRRHSYVNKLTDDLVVFDDLVCERLVPHALRDKVLYWKDKVDRMKCWKALVTFCECVDTGTTYVNIKDFIDLPYTPICVPGVTWRLPDLDADIPNCRALKTLKHKIRVYRVTDNSIKLYEKDLSLRFVWIAAIIV
jgi:hypothetical protein